MTIVIAIMDDAYTQVRKEMFGGKLDADDPLYEEMKNQMKSFKRRLGLCIAGGAERAKGIMSRSSRRQRDSSHGSEAVLPPLPGETMVEGNEEDHDEIIEPDIIDMDAKLNLILDFVAARGGEHGHFR